MSLQHTINKQASLKGTGIHTGKEIEVVFKPAEADSGVTFIRTDLPGRPVIPARLSSLVDFAKSPRRTSIGTGTAEIHTIEHFLASLSGLEIDNIIVELNGPELPGVDGSAAEFVRILRESGIKEQDAVRKSFCVREPIHVEDGDSMIAIFPDANLRISYTLNYPTTNFKTQYNHFLVTPEKFEKDIACCRTFCLEEEVDRLRALGLGKGASLQNTVVVGKKGIVSGTLRFEDEFLRHKVLDMIGDLYLLGYPVKGHVVAIKSGHMLNLKLLKAIAEQKERYEAGAKEMPLSIPPLPPGGLDSDAIKKILPHRYPFLMIDRIVELGELTAVGIKNLTENDYFFAGHFPGTPVMPGVLILEALAQVGGVLMLSKRQNQGKIAYFMSINNAKFRKIVKPGDVLRLSIEVVKFKTKTGQVRGLAYVGEDLAAEADLMFVIGD